MKAVGLALRARWSHTTLVRSALRPTEPLSLGVVTSKPAREVAIAQPARTRGHQLHSGLLSLYGPWQQA